MEEMRKCVRPEWSGAPPVRCWSATLCWTARAPHASSEGQHGPYLKRASGVTLPMPSYRGGGYALACAHRPVPERWPMALRGPHTVDTRRGEPSAEEEQEVQHIGGAASIHHPISSLNLSTLPPHSTPKFSANLINMSPCHICQMPCRGMCSSLFANVVSFEEPAVPEPVMHTPLVQVGSSGSEKPSLLL